MRSVQVEIIQVVVLEVMVEILITEVSDPKVTSPIYRGSENAILYPNSNKSFLTMTEFFIHEIFHVYQHSIYGDVFLNYGKDLNKQEGEPGYIYKYGIRTDHLELYYENSRIWKFQYWIRMDSRNNWERALFILDK